MGILDGILDAVGIGTTGVPWGTIAQVGGSLIGSGMQASGVEDTNRTNQEIAQNNSAFNAAEMQKSRDFNADQARINREFQDAQASRQMGFQEEMSNTAYVRATKDMMNAGLNPMLAYSQGGASQPTGASAGGSAATGGAATAIQPAPMQNKWANAAQAASQITAIENTAAQTENIKADTENKKAELAGKQGSGQLNDATVANLRSQTTANLAQADLTATMKQKVTEEVNKVLQEIENLVKAGKQIDAQTALTKVNTVLANYEVPLAKNIAGAQSSWWMRNVSPYLPDFLKSVHSAGQIRNLK
ncbi:MAG: DNA pilot protein [Microviridae sp.]|nr:MAG: DNA pilot protein [Microviridae sp.]